MSLALNEVRKVKIGGRYRNVEITGEVADIERRMRDGDATCGWLGDDTLTLHIAIPVDGQDRPIPGMPTMFEVWGQDAMGQRYPCLQWPRADASLLKALAERDVRTGNTLEAFLKSIEKAESDREKAFQEKLEAGYDKLQWAAMKDTGHLEGATKRLHSVDGFKKEAK